MSAFFKGLNREQIDKINDLIKILNEKDELVESQDILIREQEKYVNLEKALTHETKQNKILASELKPCNDSISCLKIENDDLCAKIKELNVLMRLHLRLNMFPYALDVKI